jgi:GWxTD domain-containing protein
MKKFFYLTILMAAFGFRAFSSSPENIKSSKRPAVNAYLNYAVFYEPKQGPYIEVYLNVTGHSVIFKKVNQKFQGKVHVEIAFLRNNKVVKEDTYNPTSPEILDTANKPNFINVQRYGLSAGEYTLKIKIKDANNPDTAVIIKASQTVLINQPTADSAAVSNIELLESFGKSAAPSIFTKSGYDVTPYVWRYYPENVNKLSFYAEGYNAKKKLGADSRFVFVYFIEGAETKEKLKDFHTFLKQKSEDVNPLLSQFDISQLPSGEYNLVVEMRNGTNDLLAERKLPFSRHAVLVKIKLDDISSVDTTGTFISKITNLDTLRDYIACMWPISSSLEREWQYNQIKNADSKLMQQYMYAFWVNRDPENPEKEWKRYRAAAVQIKKKFACGKIPGYMTDRGRVYLQYGQPSASQQVPSEPDSYPYEMWQYYKLRDPATGSIQSNKKFIFYNRELDGKCYELIHSDVRGELRDDRWQIKLKQRNSAVPNLDDNSPVNSSSYGSGASDIFQNPR